MKHLLVTVCMLLLFNLLTVDRCQGFISLSQIRSLVGAGRDTRQLQVNNSAVDISNLKLKPLEQKRNHEEPEISLKQIMDFKQLGKFQLSQIRRQLDYGSVLNNYRMNINFQLRKVGLLNPPARAENNTACYEEIGCIEISDKWYSMTRPVNLLPLDRYVINTQFLLRTRNNLQERNLKLFESESFGLSGFKEGKPVKLIIHGFIDTGRENWVKDMAETF